MDATELAARLAGLSTVLQRHLAQADSGDGLTRARLSALALLVLGGPRTLGELAAAERVRPPTMTRLVHALEADGLVVRERNPADGRSIIIRATPDGEAQLERGRSRQIAPLAEAIAQLGNAPSGCSSRTPPTCWGASCEGPAGSRPNRPTDGRPSDSW